MNDAPELLAVVDAVVSALTQTGTPYFVTGSLASSVHGEFRATNDLDIVAKLSAAQLPSLLDKLSAGFVADIDQATNALAEQSGFNLIHRVTYLKVDIFPCSSSFDNEAMRRAEAIAIPGSSESVRVATKEDILLAKLRWYQLGSEESEMQRRDIQRLVTLNRADFDDAYLSHWAEQLQVTALLQRFSASR